MMCNSERIEQAVKDYLSGRDREENARLIYECYHPLLIGFFARRGFPRDLCRDLTHDVFVRVFTHIAEFRRECPFGAWLFKIAHSIRSDHLRGQVADKRKGQTISLDSGGGDGENQSFPLDFPDLSPTSGPLAAVLDKERKQLLYDALAKLPEQMRKCWIFRELQGLSYKEIAIAMGGISVETVKAHLRQARMRLKAILTPE